MDTDRRSPGALGKRGGRLRLAWPHNIQASMLAQQPLVDHVVLRLRASFLCSCRLTDPHAVQKLSGEPLTRH